MGMPDQRINTEPPKPRAQPYRRLARALAVLGLAGLSACASMSVEECLHADWYQRGIMDGEEGKSRSYVEEHAQACKEAHIVPDFGTWAKGWERGIQRFCTPTNGFERGRRGSYYNHSCPPQYESEFMAAYRQGKAIYDAERKIDSLDSQIREREKRLRDSKNDRERDNLRSQIRDLDRDMRQAREDLYRAERRARQY